MKREEVKVLSMEESVRGPWRIEEYPWLREKAGGVKRCQAQSNTKTPKK